MKSKVIALTLVAIIAGAGVLAMGGGKQKVAWIDPSNPYANYLIAAAQKKKVPVEFTTKKSSATLLVTLTAEERKGSTWRAVFTGRSGRASALSMEVSDAKSGDVEFAYTCHKGGHALLGTGHTGFQSVAECLAKHWREKLK